MSKISSDGRPVGSMDDFIRFKDGDHEAYHTYYKQLFREIYYFLCTLTVNSEDAEDLATDVFVRLYNSRSSIEFPHLIRPFLYTVAKHLAFNLYKRQQVRTAHAAKLPLDDPEYIDTQFIANDLINYLFRFLTPAQSDIMTLYRQGLSTKEIAERLGSTKQNILNHRAKAIEKIQKHIRGKDLLFILLLLSPTSIDNQHFKNTFSIGVQNISKKDLN